MFFVAESSQEELMEGRGDLHSFDFCHDLLYRAGSIQLYLQSSISVICRQRTFSFSILNNFW